MVQLHQQSPQLLWLRLCQRSNNRMFTCQCRNNGFQTFRTLYPFRTQAFRTLGISNSDRNLILLPTVTVITSALTPNPNTSTIPNRNLRYRYPPTIPTVRYSEDLLFGLGLEVRVRMAYLQNSGPS